MLGNFLSLEPLKSKSPSIIKFSGNSVMSDPLKFKEVGIVIVLSGTSKLNMPNKEHNKKQLHDKKQLGRRRKKNKVEVAYAKRFFLLGHV